MPSDDKRARKILLTSDKFYVGQDGLLYRLDKDQKRNVRDSSSQLDVPPSMKFEVLSNVHDHVSGAHFGVHKTFHKVKQRYWWNGMFKVIPFNCIAHPSCASFFAGLARARARARSELDRFSMKAQLFRDMNQTNSVTPLFYSIYLSKIRLHMIYSNLKTFSLFNFEIFRLIYYLQ